MALKMLYRGPSSRLETLIEKIQQNKDSSPDIESSNTSPSYSPSLPDMATSPNNEMDSINNNNKITQKTHQHHHSTADEQLSTPLNGKNNNNNVFSEPNDDRNEQKLATASLIAPTKTTASETAAKESGILYSSAVKSNATRPLTEHPTKAKTENGNRLAKYGKINGTNTQLSTNSTNNNNNNNVEGSYHCQFCDKSFPRLGYLKKHEQSHAEHMPFKCDYCARLFKHKRSRDRHTKLHTGDRRYRCPHCEAAFSRSDHLKIHMKTHDNQKPFQCTVCNRGYNTAAALTSHMQNHKKQAALQRNNTLNYSPRSTGSTSSGNSLYKRKYSPHIDPHRDTPSSQSILSANAKRIAYNTNNNSVLYCIYCTKNDFENLEQLHAHVQQMHAFVLQESATASPFPGIHPGLHLSCEFCTMKFSSVTSMFHHIRTMHIDRIHTNYMEHVGRQSIGEFEEFYHRKSNESFAQPAELAKGSDEAKIDTKADNLNSESRNVSAPRNGNVKQEDLPTDLSNKKINTEEKVDASDEPAKENSPESYSSMIRRFEKQSKATKDHSIARENADLLRCNQCNLVSPNFEAFREHLRGHLARGESKNFVCFHCGTPFNNQNEYELHVSSHFLITSTEHACNFGCNKQFENSDSLQKHLFEMHAQNVWKCGICYELFESKVGIQIHFAVAHANKEKTFRCSACIEAFETETDFKNHVRSQHALMFSLPNLQCPLCRTVCSSDLEMHFHLATHPRQYRCTLCPDSFNVEFLLERHMQMHHSSTEKETIPIPFKIDNLNNNIFDYNYSNAKKLYPFAASATNKMFDPLNIQATSSMKLPPPSLYELYDNLGKSFYGEIAANKHFMNFYKTDYASKMNMRSNPLVLLPTHSSELHQMSAIEQREYFDKKTPTIEQTVPCGICERSDFQSEAEMQTHQKIAHNIKTGVSLRCAYCNDNFRSRHDLENHMKVAHTGGKHKCLICDDIFPSPNILAEHKLSHSRIGVRGKCAYCSANLTDIQSFKLHMTEHGNVDLPVQCICCRQTLNSNYEIELHAKFHIKSVETIEKKTCELCLAPLSSATGMKVCKKCYEKHSNQSGKFIAHGPGLYTKRITPEHDHNQVKPDPINEHYCNLCKKIFATVAELENHLIEHSFQGCEERGYKCYICSSIFTLTSGLHHHMLEHGSSYRPYDCSFCPNKYFFRAELDNHLIDHENGRIDTHRPSSNDGSKLEKKNLTEDNGLEPKSGSSNLAIKSEINAEQNYQKPDEDDEYIEVEQMEFQEQNIDKNQSERIDEHDGTETH